MTVSDVLLEVLAAHGVEHLFGIPGDAINDVTDALRRQDRIRFIGVRHEETGALAASVQAKLTGRLAACMGTSGPGGIHLLNGLYDARMDHAPVIAITGQVATGVLGTEAHQEVRLDRLFADVAVYSQTVTTEAQVPDVFLEACRAAIAYRGVAHVSIPTDVSGRKHSLSSDQPIKAALAGRISPVAADCGAALELIGKSERVAVLAGIGCLGARDELLAFAEAVQAPIIRSLKAKEIIDDDHRLCAGGLGLLGGKPAVKAMDECDLLILVGTDFPYRDFYPKSAKVIQIDIEPTRIGRRHPVDIGLVGHAGPTLATLAKGIKGQRSGTFLTEIQSHMADWRKSRDKDEASDATPINPPRLVSALSKVAPDNAIFIADTGTSTAWAARHLHVRPGQRFTLSGGLATMAIGLPGAIGAQLAYPDHRAIALVGDGAFAMLSGDLVTAVRYKLPIVIVVLNNAKLGFITLEQEAKGLPDWGTDILNPDFLALARAYGAAGFRVTDPGALETTLKEALAEAGPAVVDVVVDPDALIMPPTINASQAYHFGLAKLRELLGQ
ncbi:thiamine pyrophosphate-dependent enzyme [Aurantimonas sp. A3-2-R12]|uniref:thiamine pyrophosphate-dependent enzyme n=1 Tax=Aurantimonas sp. A3-2-R12 TaxID=3114362 RepID=UPI002E1953AC|nr:thiamine pyrophosphate-dependent enzyme [Aurantimonas sp. A3-2-R12]